MIRLLPLLLVIWSSLASATNLSDCWDATHYIPGHFVLYIDKTSVPKVIYEDFLGQASTGDLFKILKNNEFENIQVLTVAASSDEKEKAHELLEVIKAHGVVVNCEEFNFPEGAD